MNSTEQNILQLSALFEGEFSIDWIVELTDSKASQVISVLEESVSKKSIRHKGAGVYFYSDSTHRNRLLKEISEKQKKRYHKEIADILVRELPEDDNKSSKIANHLIHTENDFEKCQLLIRAGDCHLKKYRTHEAFRCYAKALEDLADLSGDHIDQIFAQTAIKYSKISTARHDTSRVIETLKDALSRACKTGDKGAEALLEMHLAKNKWLKGSYTSAMKHFDKGWKMAAEIDNPKVQRSATTFGAFFLFWQGRFEEAVESYENYVSDVEKYPKGGFPLLATMTLGYCYSQIGQVTQGLGMIDAVRTICLEREDHNLAAYTAGNMGCIMADIHQFDDAINHIKISAKESSKASNNWVRITGYIVLAYCYFHKGDIKRSIQYLNDFLEQREEIQAVVNLYPYLLELLWMIEQGKLPMNIDLSLKQELKRTIRSKNVFMKGIAYRYQALLEKQNNGSREKIKQLLDQSLKWLQMSGHQFQLAETQLELARFYIESRNIDTAKELTKSASEFLASYSEIKIPDDLRSLVDDQPINEQLLKEILHLGQKVADVVYSKDLLNKVMTSVNRMTGAERCALFLLDEDKDPPSFQLRASKNLTQAQVNHPDFSSSLKMLEKVAREGKGMIMESDQSEESSFFSNEKIRSRICVPMVLRQKTIGVLYNDNRLLSSAFKKSDLDLLAFFAAQAAFALDNAKAYNEIKQLNQKLRQEKEYYKEEHTQNLKSNNIIGNSPAMRKVLAQVEQVATTEATALILGNTGVGKELVAREIHNQSARKDKPFIRVHCAALPESLIPSELFGHEKGSFTGATGRKLGRFELADGGTLFLDEIGDIPPDIQVRLLRVLQTHEFERVGGTETLQSDFRLITATNKNLEKEVKENRFRADLFYRLNVFPIRVPDLNERKIDIPLLADHFLYLYSKKMGKPYRKIPSEEIDKLMQYDWPGNVRELENVIERGTILSTGPNFRIPELGIGKDADPADESLSLQEVEKRHIINVLNRTNWKIRGPGGAAELLEIHPSTLHFRMKKLGIQKERQGDTR